MNTRALRSALIGAVGVALALTSGSAWAITFRLTNLGTLAPGAGITTWFGGAGLAGPYADAFIRPERKGGLAFKRLQQQLHESREIGSRD